MIDHPLTDELCEDLMQRTSKYPYTDDVIEDMRTAYDKGGADMLEQVVEWLKVNLMKPNVYGGYEYLYLDYSDSEIEIDLVIKDLKKAMRPLHPIREEDN